MTDSTVPPTHWSVLVFLTGGLLLVMAIVVAAFSGCVGWDAPNAAATKGTEAYPCGPTGEVCSREALWSNDLCCNENQTCPSTGGIVHAGDCPVSGMCCDNGEDFDPSPQYGAIWGDAGTPKRARHLTPIRKAVP